MRLNTHDLREKGIAFVVLGVVLLIGSTILRRVVDIGSDRANDLNGAAVVVSIVGVLLFLIGNRSRSD